LPCFDQASSALIAHDERARVDGLGDCGHFRFSNFYRFEGLGA